MYCMWLCFLLFCQVHPSGRVIEFEIAGCPFREHLFELERKEGIVGEILFVIYPETDMVRYRILCVNVEGEKFNSR